MKRTIQITIEDRIYSITQYMATRGQQLLIRLMKLFGKSFGLLADQAKGEVSSILDMELTSIIESVVENLEPEASTALIKDILVGTVILENGQMREINFDLDFSGRYLHLGKLLKEVLGFQYSDFLGGLASLGQGMARQQPQSAN